MNLVDAGNQGRGVRPGLCLPPRSLWSSFLLAHLLLIPQLSTLPPASWGAFLPSPNSVPGLSLCALTCDGGGLIHSCSSPPWEVRSGCLSPLWLPEQKGTLSPKTNMTAKSKDKVLARRVLS